MDGRAERAVSKNFVWNSERWVGFEPRPDDIVIATPPKSGTTWMQMQVALLLFRSPVLPAPLARLSPWLEMNTRPLAEVLADLDAQTHRRFIKTHTALDGLPWDERITYVHVARDPRDAALSWDNHMANMDKDRLLVARAEAVGLDDLAELGIGGPTPPPPDDPAERFWRWMEGAGEGPMLAHHIGVCRSFWERRHEPNVHLFHYGDLQADLAGEMTRLAGALGLEPPTAELVAAARFDQMKARADELAPNTDTGLWHSNQQFFDKGRSGEWQEVVDDADLPRYDAAVRAQADDDELIHWLHHGSRG
ncbi:MAG: sulfotransferase domain-containing protein [Acidimicrobiales bacterium]